MSAPSSSARAPSRRVDRGLRRSARRLGCRPARAARARPRRRPPRARSRRSRRRPRSGRARPARRTAAGSGPARGRAPGSRLSGTSVSLVVSSRCGGGSPPASPTRSSSPAPEAGCRRERRTGDGVERAALSSAPASKPPPNTLTTNRTTQRERGLAQRVERVARRSPRGAGAAAQGSSAMRARSAIRSRSSPASWSVSSGISWLPAAVCTHDGGEVEALLEDAGGRVDVLDAHHRHERAADRQRAARMSIASGRTSQRQRRHRSSGHEQRADRQAGERHQRTSRRARRRAAPPTTTPAIRAAPQNSSCSHAPHPAGVRRAAAGSARRS